MNKRKLIVKTVKPIEKIIPKSEIMRRDFDMKVTKTLRDGRIMCKCSHGIEWVDGDYGWHVCTLCKYK